MKLPKLSVLLAVSCVDDPRRAATRKMQRPSHNGLKIAAVRESGFSLVEFVLAIGVVAFAFVGLLGLLPVGLTTFGAALDTSVRSQIVQRFVSDAEQTDFDTLKSQTAPLVRYFDDEGSEKDKSTSVYTASMTVNPVTALPKSATSKNLLTLTIKIAKDPGHAADPFATTSKLKTWTDVAFVARNLTHTN